MATSLHRVFSAAALLSAAFVCSSCGVYWNTGYNVMQAPVTYTGVDLDNPVGGVVYRAGKGKDAAYYMEAPEYTYKTSRPVVSFHGMVDLKSGGSPFCPDSYAVKPTGKTRWVQVEGSEKNSVGRDPVEEHYRKTGKMSLAYASPIAKDVTLPKNAKAYPYKPAVPSCESVLETHRSWLYAPACIIGAPLRYVVDPALSVASTAVVWAGGIIATPFVIPVQQAQKEHKPE